MMELGIILYHNGKRLTADARYLVQRHDAHPICTMNNLHPTWPEHSRHLFRAILTPRGELDAGWLLVHAALDIEQYHAGERPGLLYIGEPTADPSCLLHFPSPNPEFAGRLTLALRRAR